MHAVATTPAEPSGASLIPTRRRRPSLNLSKVGFRIALFEACSAFTARYGLHARHPSLGRALHQRLQQFRYLHYCSDCYRLERHLPDGFRTH